MPDDLFSDEDLQLKPDKKVLIVVILLVVLAVPVILSLFVGLSSSSGTEAYIATGDAQCARYLKDQCAGKIVKAGSFEFDCKYKENLNRCSVSDSSRATYQQNNYGRTYRPDFSWIAYPLFLVAGYFVIVATKKFVGISKSDFALALLLAGTMLIFISILVLVWLTPFVQNYETLNFFDNFLYGWLVKLVIFFTIGIILYIIGNKLNSDRTPVIALISFVTLPTLFLSTISTLALGLYNLIAYKPPSWIKPQLQFTTIEMHAWVVTFIILTILTVISFRFVKKHSDIKALNPFRYCLKIGGWIYSAIALLIFVSGIITFNFASFETSNFIQFILQPIIFGLIGGLCLIEHGRLKTK